MEPLLYFFVDAASPIDPEDPDWHLLTAVEQSGQGSTEVLGYATCCEPLGPLTGLFLALGDVECKHVLLRLPACCTPA